MQVWHALVIIALLCGANWYTDGAVVNAPGNTWKWVATFGHQQPGNTIVNNQTNVPTYIVEQADGSTATTTTKPNPNYYHLVDGIWMITKAASDSGNPYASWPTAGTLVFDQSYYQGLINTLKQAYPDYTLKVYDGGRMRVLTESWVRDIYSRSQNLADNSKSTTEDLADQTYQGRFSDNLGLFLQKKNGNGWDLVVPVMSANDESVTKIFEIPARSTYLDNPKDLPTTAPSTSGSSKTGLSFQSTETIAGTGTTRFDSAASSPSASPTSGTPSTTRFG